MTEQIDEKPREWKPMDYIHAHQFIQSLKRQRKVLSSQELHTLRGQALAGDVDGAIVGLERILRERA